MGRLTLDLNPSSTLMKKEASSASHSSSHVTKSRFNSESGLSLRRIFFTALGFAIFVPTFVTFTFFLEKHIALNSSKQDDTLLSTQVARKKARDSTKLLRKAALEDAIQTLRSSLNSINSSYSNHGGIYRRYGCGTGESNLGTHNRPPLIIAVTPTYTRAWQAAHMTQVVNILRLITPPLLWIVVESENKTEETRLLLERTAGRCISSGVSNVPVRINYVHISTGVPHGPTFISRGVEQRNIALQVIEAERINGIVYFMDDDNVYTVELFKEIRKVRKIGVLPVGFLWSAEAGIVRPRKQTYPFVERALVRHFTRRSHVFGWETFQWAFGKYSRKFHVDMAGMAFNSTMLWKEPNPANGRPRHPVRFHAKSGYLETQFIDRLIDNELELEPLANDCQDVLVWHTHAEARISDPYPLNWHLPQPVLFDLDRDPSSKSPYWIKRMRYSVRGHKGHLPFGYKSGINGSTVNPVSPDEVDKSLNFGLTLSALSSAAAGASASVSTIAEGFSGSVASARSSSSPKSWKSSQMESAVDDTQPVKFSKVVKTVQLDKARETTEAVDYDDSVTSKAESAGTRIPAKVLVPNPKSLKTSLVDTTSHEKYASSDSDTESNEESIKTEETMHSKPGEVMRSGNELLLKRQGRRKNITWFTNLHRIFNT